MNIRSKQKIAAALVALTIHTAAFALDCNLLGYRVITFHDWDNPMTGYQSSPSVIVSAEGSVVFANGDLLNNLRNHNPEEFTLTKRHATQSWFAFDTLDLDGASGGQGSLQQLNPGNGPSEELWNVWGKAAQRLVDIKTEAKEISLMSLGSARQKKFNAFKKKLSGLSDEFAFLDDGSIMERMDDDYYSENPVELVDHYVVKLPWNSVRIAYHDKSGKNLGYFIPIAWSPIERKLIFSGQDYVPTEYLYKPENGTIPRGCGLPLDVRGTQANCGLAAFSALLGISSEKAVLDVIPEWKKKPYLEWDDVSKGLMRFGWNPKKIWIKQKMITQTPSKAFEKHKKGMVLIMFTKDKKSIHVGHWASYADGKVYDINVRGSDGQWGGWVPEKEWVDKIVPGIYPSGQANGFYISTLLVK